MGAYAFLLFAVFVLPCSHGCGEGSPKDRADPDFDSDSNSDPDSDSDSNSDPDSDPDSDSDSDPAPLNSICGNGVCEEGEDVSDIWKGADRSRANPLFWRTSKSNAMVSMVQENWKLHIEGESVELYDLSKDAGETGNLADKYPDIAKKMRNKAKRWESQLPMDYAKETDPPKNDPVERPRVVGPAPL